MFERGGGAGLCNANDEVGLNAINSVTSALPSVSVPTTCCTSMYVHDVRVYSFCQTAHWTSLPRFLRPFMAWSEPVEYPVSIN